MFSFPVFFNPPLASHLPKPGKAGLCLVFLAPCLSFFLWLLPHRIQIRLGPLLMEYTTQQPRLYSGSDVIIEVSGYAYASRMANIEDRLKAIAIEVKKALGLGDAHRASITYFVVEENYWAAV
jgi:hypothetical protein